MRGRCLGLVVWRTIPSRPCSGGCSNPLRCLGEGELERDCISSTSHTIATLHHPYLCSLINLTSFLIPHPSSLIFHLSPLPITRTLTPSPPPQPLHHPLNPSSPPHSLTTHTHTHTHTPLLHPLTTASPPLTTPSPPLILPRKSSAASTPSRNGCTPWVTARVGEEIVLWLGFTCG